MKGSSFEDITMHLQLALPVATAAFFLAAIVWPIVRLWRRTGTFGVVVHRKADPFQSFVGTAFGVTLAAVLAWASAFGLLGPERMGVWPTAAAVGWAGWTLFAAGFAVTVAAQADMGASWRIGIDDRPTGLVRGGLYAWVRNPIYTGLLTMLAGLVLIAPSAWTIMGFADVLVLVGLQARLEEQHLARQHGDDFRAWAARVGRFLPGIGRLDPV
jgi:protein-S-isoprenylcysteine O-methyltransferase Ste14